MSGRPGSMPPNINSSGKLEPPSSKRVGALSCEHQRRAPPDQLVHGRSQLSTPIGELVAALCVTTDDPRTLELAQPLGEEVGGDACQAVLELAVARGANQQLAHDEEGPPVADHVEGFGEGAVLVVGTHAQSLHFK